MDRTAYEKMAENEREHWWFAGRRAILARLIERLVKDRPGPLTILEAGCGSGGNLRLLSRFGAVDGFEFDAEARALAVEKGIAAITHGELPDTVPQQDDSYDLVALFDVLEHIAAHRESLETLGRKLKPDGHILITVPAMPWLWSEHDERHHHQRRYTATSLRTVIEEAGLKVTDIGYFNALLFPLAVAERLRAKLFGPGKPGEEMPSALVNRTLRTVFAFERHFIGTRLHAPAGLSLYAVVGRS